MGRKVPSQAAFRGCEQAGDFSHLRCVKKFFSEGIALKLDDYGAGLLGVFVIPKNVGQVGSQQVEVVPLNRAKG